MKLKYLLTEIKRKNLAEYECFCKVSGFIKNKLNYYENFLSYLLGAAGADFNSFFALRLFRASTMSKPKGTATNKVE